MNRFLSGNLIMIGSLLFFMVSCFDRSGNNNVKVGTSSMAESPITSIDLSPTRYDIFIENSGSVKGFFNGDTNAKTILQQFYYRLDQDLMEEDTITLNFINTSISSYNRGINDYLRDAYSRCNASLSKIDEILAMAIDNTMNESGKVSLLMSDFCFESDETGFEGAQAHITNIFTKRLNNSDIAIAIFKFNSHFKGKYFPGGINCDRELPFYIWAFGPSEKIKKIVELPNIQKEEVLVLQSGVKPQHRLITNNARMIGPNGSVIVKKWRKKSKEEYVLSFDYNISKIILPESSIADINNYTVTKGYEINTIKTNGSNCQMTISTDRRSVGELVISYDNDLPDWVNDSNYEGVGIPPEGQTLGIKYLIEGVYDAFRGKSSNIYEIRIKMIKE